MRPLQKSSSSHGQLSAGPDDPYWASVRRLLSQLADAQPTMASQTSSQHLQGLVTLQTQEISCFLSCLRLYDADLSLLSAPTYKTSGRCHTSSFLLHLSCHDTQTARRSAVFCPPISSASHYLMQPLASICGYFVFHRFIFLSFHN